MQEAGWAPGPVWTGAENLAPTGIRSPDRAARSQSLYQLRYPAHVMVGGQVSNVSTAAVGGQDSVVSIVTCCGFKWSGDHFPVVDEFCHALPDWP